MALIDDVFAAYMKNLRRSQEYREHVANVKAKAFIFAEDSKLTNQTKKRTLGMSRDRDMQFKASYPMELVFAHSRAYPNMAERERLKELAKIAPECSYTHHG